MVPATDRLLKRLFCTGLFLLVVTAALPATARQLSSPLVLESGGNTTRVLLTTPKKVSFTLTFPAGDLCGVVLKGLSISTHISVPTPNDRLLRSVEVKNSKEGI